MTTNELKHLKDTLTPSELSQLLWTCLADKEPTREDTNRYGDVEWFNLDRPYDTIYEGAFTMYRHDPTDKTKLFWRSSVYPIGTKFP